METKIFYKYKSLNAIAKKGEKSSYDYTIDSLQNKYFYFSSPKQLNDAKDMAVYISFASSGNEIWKYVQEKRSVIPNFPFENPIYDISKDKEMSINWIRKNLLTESEKMKTTEKSNFLKKNCHILCLCPSFNINKMWERYGNDGYGIAIGYEAYNPHPDLYPDDFLIELQKQTLPSLIPNFIELDGKLYFPIKKIEYIEKKQKYKVIEVNSVAVEKSLMAKLKKIWAVEKEYRSIFISNPLNSNPTPLKLYYPKEIVSEIIFGEKIPTCEITNLKNIISSAYKGIPIKYYKIVNTNGTLTRQSI